MPEERLMTVVEVAELLQVDEQTIRRWIRQGRLAAHNLGGKAGYRIQRRDLQTFLEQTRGSGELAGKEAA